MTESRVAAIHRILAGALGTQDIEVIDDSHLHVGHEGARDGRGHFTVRIVSDSFEGLRPLQRHRLVYDALDDMMKTDIHALRIDARTPAEIHEST